LRQLKYLPCTLTCLRLLLGPLALICAFQDYGRWIYLPILATNTEIIAIHRAWTSRRWTSNPSWLCQNPGLETADTPEILMTQKMPE